MSKGAGRDSSSCYLLAISCLKGIYIYVAIKIEDSFKLSFYYGLIHCSFLLILNSFYSSDNIYKRLRLYDNGFNIVCSVLVESKTIAL
jgi:hypothetical protein